MTHNHTKIGSPVVQDQTIKRYVYGTHRLRDPEDTLAQIRPHFATMGLTRIADVTGLDTIGIPVCMAVRPNSKSLSVFQGKGLTLMSAKVSAAMEAIETYHAENPSLKIKYASYHELSREAIVCDPFELNLHPLSVYHHHMKIPWVTGFDLIQEQDTYVPYELVHLQFLRGKSRLPLFFQGSNGLASGNHIQEAISHALCEVIERDSTALWELSRLEPEQDDTIVDPATIDSQAALSLIEKIETAGLAVYISNQTSDVGIPAFGCIISEKSHSGSIQRSAGGYGCHLSKEVALIRAITEAAQSRLTHISGARDDMYRHTYQLQQQSKMNPDQWRKVLQISQRNFDYSTAPSLETDSLTADVALQVSLLKKAGFKQAVAIDLSNRAFDISVAKVIIPKAEYKHPGFHKRFGSRAREQTLRTLIQKKFLKQHL